MQRATSKYLNHLYESVSSIPPDIQQCLLTIAQYGCEPEQVKRWYSVVRHHFGGSDPDSPLGAQPQDTMPPPRTPKRLHDSAGQITPTSSSSSLVSPFGFHEPTFGILPEFGEGVSMGNPTTPIQDLPLLPWPTPDTGDKQNTSQGDWTAVQASTIVENYDFDPRLEHNMMGFTGAGLWPVPESEVSKPGPLRTPKIPMPYESTMSSGAMPVFVRLQNDPAARIKKEPGKPQRTPPSNTLASQNRASTAEPAKRRKVAPSHQRTTTEPPLRPRRPSVPFRHNDQFPRHPPIAPKVETPAQQSFPNAPAIDQFPYKSSPQIQHERYSAAAPFPQPPRSSPRSADGGGYGPFNGSQQPVVYQSPYV